MVSFVGKTLSPCDKPVFIQIQDTVLMTFAENPKKKLLVIACAMHVSISHHFFLLHLDNRFKVIFT